MPSSYDENEAPFPLTRRASFDEEGSIIRPFSRDRLRSGTSGALVGFVAGAAALGIVQVLAPGPLLASVGKGAAHFGLAFGPALAIAYASSGVVGAVVGAMFAGVTKYLRRWLPLLVWSLVFFGSVAMLGLAASRTWAHGPSDLVMKAIFAAAGVYALLMPFSLSIRKRTQPF